MLNAIIDSLVFSIAGALIAMGIFGLLLIKFGERCPRCQSLKIVQFTYRRGSTGAGTPVNFCHKCGTIL